MLGEDLDTELAVRERLTAANRGLLALLLHGNCRVLGVKEPSGRLLAGAVARLLVDAATARPVSE